MKANELKITGNEIILSTPKGSMAGFRWDGQKLIHSTGKAMRFNAEISDSIGQAVKDSHHAKYETKYGYEFKDGDREGWEFSHVENDAHGVYSRCTRTRISKSVFFAKEDLA